MSPDVHNPRNRIKPLPDDNIFGLPKLKAFADDKSNVTQNIKVVFHRLESIVGKEENAGNTMLWEYQSKCFMNNSREQGNASQINPGAITE